MRLGAGERTLPRGKLLRVRARASAMGFSLITFFPHLYKIVRGVGYENPCFMPKNADCLAPPVADVQLVSERLFLDGPGV